MRASGDIDVIETGSWASYDSLFASVGPARLVGGGVAVAVLLGNGWALASSGATDRGGLIVRECDGGREGGAGKLTTG